MKIVKAVPVVIIVVLALVVGACAQSKKDAEETGDKKVADKAQETVIDTKGAAALIETKYGEIKIKFFPDVAPKHVENFITLAKDGIYDGTIFHRVIPGFMIQGGDPNTKGPNKATYGSGGPGHNVKAEFNDKSHKRGIVSMARSQDPDSAGSQFFIVVKDSVFLDRQYTVFAEVVEGMDVVDTIVNLTRNRTDLPDERVEMTIKIVE
jgi:peptidyl-prolyl cis-trans isomerase B (cyclophilin B)